MTEFALNVFYTRSPGRNVQPLAPDKLASLPQRRAHAGHRGIQSGFAAASEGLSTLEWNSLPIEEQRERKKYLQGTPSVKLALESQTHAQPESGPEAEIKAWYEVWDNGSDTSSIPVEWGWHAQNDTQRRTVNHNLAIPAWNNDATLDAFAQHWFELDATAVPNNEESFCYTLITHLPTSTNDLEEDFGLYTSKGQILVTEGLSDLFARIELAFQLNLEGS
ncbi:hypothetical protein D9757_014236 [Collybiopsis confluens]|uniref:Uncharacterized protein n=1 Tax=Collybiopsis confluens TaxID=2823264 RepID=A0A8H5CKL1_9AGAR|nr:hypothetical protein D9757_014236 [Collybiopsis confluens]